MLTAGGSKAPELSDDGSTGERLEPAAAWLPTSQNGLGETDLGRAYDIDRQHRAGHPPPGNRVGQREVKPEHTVLGGGQGTRVVICPGSRQRVPQSDGFRVDVGAVAGGRGLSGDLRIAG